jgi:hypothetical protein
LIELKTFGRHVLEISEKEINVSKNISTSKIGIYRAPSTSALVEITDTKLKLVVGKDIPDLIYKHLLGLALTHKKRLEITECENLKNLNKIDKLVELYNNEFSLYI